MLLRPKCQQQHNQIEVTLGHEAVFGRLTFGLNDLQISREQGALRAGIDGRLELTACGAGRMRVLRIVTGAAAPSLVNTPPYMPKGEKVTLQPGDEIQLLVAKREEGQQKALPRVIAAWTVEVLASPSVHAQPPSVQPPRTMEALVSPQPPVVYPSPVARPETQKKMLSSSPQPPGRPAASSPASSPCRQPGLGEPSQQPPIASAAHPLSSPPRPPGRSSSSTASPLRHRPHLEPTQQPPVAPAHRPIASFFSPSSTEQRPAEQRPTEQRPAEQPPAVQPLLQTPLQPQATLPTTVRLDAASPAPAPEAVAWEAPPEKQGQAQAQGQTKVQTKVHKKMRKKLAHAEEPAVLRAKAESLPAELQADARAKADAEGVRREAEAPARCPDAPREGAPASGSGPLPEQLSARLSGAVVSSMVRVLSGWRCSPSPPNGDPAAARMATPTAAAAAGGGMPVPCGLPGAAAALRTALATLPQLRANYGTGLAGSACEPLLLALEAAVTEAAHAAGVLEVSEPAIEPKLEAMAKSPLAVAAPRTAGAPTRLKVEARAAAEASEEEEEEGAAFTAQPVAEASQASLASLASQASSVCYDRAGARTWLEKNARQGCTEVLCGLCDKWRFLPRGYDDHTMSQFEALEWDCSMHPNPLIDSCGAPCNPPRLGDEHQVDRAALPQYTPHNHLRSLQELAAAQVYQHVGGYKELKDKGWPEELCRAADGPLLATGRAATRRLVTPVTCLPGELRLRYVRQQDAQGSKQGGFPKGLAEGEPSHEKRKPPKRAAGTKRRREVDWDAAGDSDDCFTKQEQKLRIARWRVM